MKLTDKIAIVTGAGAGNGRAIALGLAGEGADLVLADVNLDAANNVAGEVRALGRLALVVRADVTRKAEVQAMARAAVEEFGRVDVLVNNAGIRKFSTIVEMSEQEWDAHLALDLKGPFLCIQAVAPIMIKQRQGKIINITSGAAELPLRAEAHYCAAKAGLKMLTMVAALELSDYGITVNAIGPGIVEDTGMFQDIRANPAQMQRLQHTIPLKRFCNPTRDLAPLAVFLASSDSDYMTGQSIYLEGGLLLVQ
ncbi:MAG: glucose 1-dehydrogenase [Ardenticatenaceae bacterium]|nr:glucose 1-dehydrogenase [Ardenticatenaceae bacterium]